MDLFEWKGNNYLLVVDYYSRYIETALLTSSTSHAIINHLKSMFARLGMPEEVFSDNGPQFASEAFASFADEYKFRHTTSSPHFPQANGEAKRAVETVKALFKKCNDPYLALLSYRSTPLPNGHSPAELLMARKLRTNVPIVQKELIPKLPDLTSLSEWEQEKLKQSFDKNHKAHHLPHLSPGTEVWIPDQKQFGSVISSPSHRSYTGSKRPHIPYDVTDGA